MSTLSSHLTSFARKVLGRPLYSYQAEVAEAILTSVLEGQGRMFTVLMARQCGKNQLSAVIEAYLLTCLDEGSIIKAAPTFTPQILTSRWRLLSLLDNPFTRDRLWTSSGFMVGLAPRPDPSLLSVQAGPRVLFYSASPDSQVMGATADLLLEIDEAQNVDPDKFDRDFRPMASVNNATTVLYGTAWSETTLLARQRAYNLAWEQQTGCQNHFEYDWRSLAALNSSYRSFVEREMIRLGENHPVIQTQYLLHPISGASSLLTALQQKLLQGKHAWEDEPAEDECYLAGLDIGGEEQPQPILLDGSAPLRSRRRDSSVLTIGRVRYNTLHLPCLEVVHQLCWTGWSTIDQYTAVLALVEQWGLRSLVVDATGLGSSLASLLKGALGARLISFTFTRPSKSQLTYHLLALINSGRLTLYEPQQAPRAIYDTCWQQLRQARCRIPAPEILDMYVDPSEGHDDFLISLALLTHGLATFTPPPVSALVRPRRFYDHTDW